MPGYLSSVAMVPSARAAVVVLTNDESSTFLALTWALMDRAKVCVDSQDMSEVPAAIYQLACETN